MVKDNSKVGKAGPTGYGSALASYWPGLALIIGIGTVGLAMRNPVPKVRLAPPPPGWTRFPETGASICLEIKGDQVYVGGKSGLWILSRKSNGSAQRVRLPVDTIHIRSIACASDGTLWIGHTEGLIQMKGGAFRQWTKADGLPGSRVNCVREVKGRIVAGTSGGLVEFFDGRWVRPPYANQLASKVVSVICGTENGDLWIGSSSDLNGGLSRVHANGVQTWRIQDGLPHSYVQDILALNRRAVWVATGQYESGGAVLIDAKPGKAAIAKTLAKGDGLAGNKVRSIGQDASGAIWFGSENDGLAIIDHGNSIVLTVDDGLPHNEVTCICKDIDGNMWLATLNGVVKIEKPAVARIKAGAMTK